MQKRPSTWIPIIGVILAIGIMLGANSVMNPSSDPQAAEAGHEGHDHAPGEHHENEAKTETKETPKNEEKASKTKKTGSKNQMVVIDTVKGKITLKLYTEEMPITVENFKGLIEKKFYDGHIFHRVEDWVIQGGDPTGTGTGGSGKQIKLEINKKHGFDKPGALGMARSQVRDSASSQFFINTKPADWLNNDYAMFGEVTEGLDVVKNIKKGDKINSIRLVDAKEEAPKE